MSLSRFKTRFAAALAVMVMAAVPVAGSTQTIYRSVDENGVVSFSDVETDGAQHLQIVPAPVRENAQQEQQALIEQQLTVAKSLEESRLARDAARTKRIEALAAVQPKTVYYREADRTRYVGGSWGWGHRPGYPGYPSHPIYPGRPPGPVHPPVHPIEPPHVRPPSRPIPFPQQHGSGG